MALDADLISYLRRHLLPQGAGSGPVSIGFHDGLNNRTFYSQEFVTRCLDDLERRVRDVSTMHDKMNSLEVLAIQLLLSCAHISKPEDADAAIQSQKDWVASRTRT